MHSIISLLSWFKERRCFSSERRFENRFEKEKLMRRKPKLLMYLEFGDTGFKMGGRLTGEEGRPVELF